LKRLISTMAKDPSKIFYLSSSKFFYWYQSMCTFFFFRY
jgi:hypothetical protein